MVHEDGTGRIMRNQLSCVGGHESSIACRAWTRCCFREENGGSEGG